MKITFLNQVRAAGSVLVVTMSVVAVAAIVLASYLLMVQNETAAVARSQDWNALIPVAEAGVEEGLALVNTGGPIITVPMAWTNAAASAGWSLSNGVYSLTRNISGSNYYIVSVTVSGNAPLINSIGVTSLSSAPWSFSAGPQPFVAAIGVTLGNSAANLDREIQVQTVLDPLFSAAIITKSNVSMNGNTVIDSFNSSSSLYSTLGQYVAAKREPSGGNVGTDSAVLDDISLGNGNIYGQVFTGPGTAQSAVSVGSQGAVGNATWNASNTGIEPGYWDGDFNVNLPDVPAPATGGAPPAAVSGVITLNGGSYTVSAANISAFSSATLNVTAPTTVWVQGSYSPAGVGTTNNSVLTLYVGAASGTGDSLTLAGNGAMNSPGYAANLQFYGLPSLTAITLDGNAAFIGVVYAPEADLTGNGNPGPTGAFIVNSITLHGNAAIHYDQALLTSGPSRGWIASSWTEVKAP